MAGLRFIPQTVPQIKSEFGGTVTINNEQDSAFLHVLAILYMLYREQWRLWENSG